VLVVGPTASKPSQLARVRERSARRPVPAPRCCRWSRVRTHQSCCWGLSRVDLGAGSGVQGGRCPPFRPDSIIQRPRPSRPQQRADAIGGDPAGRPFQSQRLRRSCAIDRAQAFFAFKARWNSLARSVPLQNPGRWASLECWYEALLRAGVRPDSLRRLSCGLELGCLGLQLDRAVWETACLLASDS